MAYEATYNQGLKAAHLAPSASQAFNNITGLNIQIANKQAQSSNERSDGGQLNQNSGGMIGMVSQAISKLGPVGMAVAGAAIGGPVGAALGVVGVASDIKTSVTNMMKPAVEEGGHYTLAASLREMQKNKPGMAEFREHDDPILENYPCAADGMNYCHGFAQPNAAQGIMAPALQRRAFQMDGSEQKAVDQELAFLYDRKIDNEKQLGATASAAEKMGMGGINTSVAKGPTPPGMAGMGPMA